MRPFYRRDMLDALDAINAFISTQAATPWALAVLFALTILDAAVPPLPSESIVIALAAYGAANGSPNLVLLAVVATVGAWIGDNSTYTLGRHSPLHRVRDTERPRLRKAFRFAARELDHRGGVVVVVARYIPVGRVAVNVTAGASEFPRRRFMGLTGIATSTWAVYSVAIGAVAGAWVEENPLLGATGGILVAVLLGVAVDRVAQRLTTRTPRPVEEDPADPVPVESGETAPQQ